MSSNTVNAKATKIPTRADEMAEVAKANAEMAKANAKADKADKAAKAKANAKAKAAPTLVEIRNDAFRDLTAILDCKIESSAAANAALRRLSDAALHFVNKVDASATLSVNGVPMSPQRAALAMLGFKATGVTRSAIAKAAKDAGQAARII